MPITFDSLCKDIDTRLKELKPLVLEHERLTAVVVELDKDKGGTNVPNKSKQRRLQKRKFQDGEHPKQARKKERAHKQPKPAKTVTKQATMTVTGETYFTPDGVTMLVNPRATEDEIAEAKVAAKKQKKSLAKVMQVRGFVQVGGPEEWERVND
jgi:hypothetical protein